MKKIEMKNGDTLHYQEGKAVILNASKKANNALAVITDNPMIPAFVLFANKEAKKLNEDEKIAVLQACIDVSPKFEEYLKGVLWRPVIHKHKLLYLASPDFSGDDSKVGIFDVPYKSNTASNYFHCYIEAF